MLLYRVQLQIHRFIILTLLIFQFHDKIAIINNYNFHNKIPFFFCCHEFTAGECATFECTLESSISCRMQWFKDNKPLNDKLADRVNITSTDKSYKLEIKNVLESDSGIYTARAANDDGNATCTAQLIVENRKYNYN